MTEWLFRSGAVYGRVSFSNSISTKSVYNPERRKLNKTVFYPYGPDSSFQFSSP